MIRLIYKRGRQESVPKTARSGGRCCWKPWWMVNKTRCPHINMLFNWMHASAVIIEFHLLKMLQIKVFCLGMGGSVDPICVPPPLLGVSCSLPRVSLCLPSGTVILPVQVSDREVEGSGWQSGGANGWWSLWVVSGQGWHPGRVLDCSWCPTAHLSALVVSQKLTNEAISGAFQMVSSISNGVGNHGVCPWMRCGACCQLPGLTVSWCRYDTYDSPHLGH